MIRRNPDVIAIGLLLFGLAAYSLAREAGTLRVIPHQRIKISHAFCQKLSQLPSFRTLELTRD